MTIERRDLLKGAALAGLAGAAASTLPRPAIAQDRRELNMVTTWPANFPGLGTGAQRLADRITAMSDGRLTVRVYAAGELVPAFESFDAVSAGNADLFHGAAYYWQGKSKAFNFFAAVPFGLTADEMSSWIRFGGGQQLWDELAAGFNVKPFIGGNTGCQMGGWFRNEVNTVQDYNGLRFRMPGLGGEVLRRLGAAVVNLPGGEIFAALQSGAIDGTEWVGPWNDLAFGFYRVARFYYYPGFHEPGTVLECSWNLGVWNSLSAADKAIVEAATEAEADTMLAEFNARNGDALATLVNEHGVQVRRFSDELYQAFATNAEAVLSETAQADDMTRRVYDSFIAFRRKAIAWNALADGAYTELRRRFLHTE